MYGRGGGRKKKDEGEGDAGGAGRQLMQTTPLCFGHIGAGTWVRWCFQGTSRMVPLSACQ